MKRIVPAVLLLLLSCAVQAQDLDPDYDAAAIAPDPSSPDGYKSMTGTRKVLTARFEFPGYATTKTYAQLSAEADDVKNQVYNSSYRLLTLVNTVVPGSGIDAYDFPQLSTFYSAMSQADARMQMRKDAFTVLRGHGVDPATYHRLVLRFPNAGGGTIQKWTVNATRFPSDQPSQAPSTVWLNDSWASRYLAHEMGHTFFFTHSGSWVVTDGNPISPAGSPKEYGDPFCFMGWIQGNMDEMDYSPYHKYWAGWIPTAKVKVPGRRHDYHNPLPL